MVNQFDEEQLREKLEHIREIEAREIHERRRAFFLPLAKAALLTAIILLLTHLSS